MKTREFLIYQNKLLERALLISICQHLDVENPTDCDYKAFYAEIDRLIDLAKASLKLESKEEK